MSQKILKILVAASAVTVLCSGVNAQQAVDQYGFGDRAFLVQSALEAGKTAYGFWDVPGTPRKTNGNLTDMRKVKNWLEMQVWNREKGDPDDRLFTFSPAQGGSAGKYYIRFSRERNAGVDYITGTGKIEARALYAYEFRYLGKDRWKIYVKPGYVLCLEKNMAKNGTKLTLKPDHNGDDAVWVFYDLATLRSFIPASTENRSVSTGGYKGLLKDSINTKNPGTQYFQYADGAKFDSENAKGELQAYLNDKDTSDQWSAVLNLVKAVKDNKDTAARRSMFKAISEADIKAGSSFAENLLKGKFVEQINDVARGEKDSIAKGYITTIAGKIR